jgi:hypothetical protein
MDTKGWNAFSIEINMRISVKEMKAYFNSVDLPERIELDGSTIIINTRNFVNRHISMLERNTGNKTFFPYYERLVRFYNLINPDQ